MITPVKQDPNPESLESFQKRLAATEGGVVIDFSGKYCGPCKLLEPLLEELAQTYEGSVEVWVLDIELEQELAQHYGVRSVPTLLSVRDGIVQAQQIGFSGPKRVRELFSDLVAS